MLHIGILAHSADGAALCYLEMVREGARQLGAHEHPEITLSGLPMGPTLGAYRRGDLGSVSAHLARSARRLADAGCAFFACPDNTAHIALDAAKDPLPLPGLHICDVVARRAAEDGRRRLGLLGTRWTMEGPAYRAACARHRLELCVPPPAERDLVDRVIFEELCQGRLLDESRSEFVRVIAGLAREGCDVVVLGCTEIPLLVAPEQSPLPTLDSTRLLARAAVAVASGHAPPPSWRGGPFPDGSRVRTASTHAIRPATPADSDTLVAFTLNEALDAEQRTLDRTEVQRGIAGAFATPPEARYWVVESSGGLVASASIVTEWSNFRGGDYWWIQSLYIVPEHRGTGLTDILLRHLIDEARKAGALDLRLYARDTNARALRAYERLGFRDAPYRIMTRSLVGE